MLKTPVRRVLLVDDDESLLNALQRALAEGGLEVVAHTSFEPARDAIRSEQFDAVLTDVRLGAFNGLQLAVVARQQHPRIPIIIFSGFDDPVLRAEAAAIGADYLVKPVSTGKIRTLLQQNERKA